MPRPAFTVVSISVAALVSIGFISLALKPRIPPTVENNLGGEDSEFLARAAQHRIDWLKPTPEAFASARRRDLPILLFIGSSANPMARNFDVGIERSPRVQAFLERNFSCMRADILAYPEFRNAYLPLSRVALNFNASFQVWILDASGKIIDFIPQSLGLEVRDENAYIDALVAAREKFSAPTLDVIGARFQDAQVRDTKFLSTPSVEEVPDFAGFETRLESAVSPDGGLGSGVPRILAPEAWRYLLLTGRVESFRTSIDPVLRSPVVDLIDGGFFQGARDAAWLDVNYEKSALYNASMLRVLSEASALTNDRQYRYLAKRTFESLTSEFVLPAGIAANRPSDSSFNRRSARASFGVRRLREHLSEAGLVPWAQAHLGLKVETNPLMTPRLMSTQTLLDEENLRDTLARLSKVAPPPKCTNPGFTDISGFVVARLLESSRLLKHPQGTDLARSLFDYVEDAREGDTMVHSFHRAVAEPYVGDYLAYADAALQLYLCTGRYEAIFAGKAVLEKALRNYTGPQPGLLALTTPRAAPMPTTLTNSELIDPNIESITAQAIRLTLSYSKIFPEATPLRKFANDAVRAFVMISKNLSFQAAGCFLSSQMLFDDICFISTGPHAQEDADRLARARPGRLSIAAFGEIRVDIQKRGPGSYVVRGSEVSGPMTVSEALDLVPGAIGAP